MRKLMKGQTIAKFKLDDKHITVVVRKFEKEKMFKFVLLNNMRGSKYRDTLILTSKTLPMSMLFDNDPENMGHAFSRLLTVKTKQRWYNDPQILLSANCDFTEMAKLPNFKKQSKEELV